jgi:hypothetical protein
MFNFTKNSHYTYTYGRGLFDKRLEKTDKIHVTLAKPEFGQTLKAASVKAAQEIYEEHKEISICLSNGIDSMSTLQSFVEAKVPFTVYSMIMKDGFNNSDTDIAIKLCKDLGLTHHLINMDVIYFFENGRNQFWVDTLGNSNGHYNCFFEFLDKIPGCIVDGGSVPLVIGNLKNTNDMFFSNNQGRIDYVVLPDRNLSNHPHLLGYEPLDAISIEQLPLFPVAMDAQDFSLMRYLNYRNRPGIPQFFYYDPAQIGGALSLPIYSQLQNGTMSWNYNTKLEVYRSAGFDYPANSVKRTGYEDLHLHYKKNGKDLYYQHFLMSIWNLPGTYAKNLYSYNSYLENGLV